MEELMEELKNLYKEIEKFCKDESVLDNYNKFNIKLNRDRSLIFKDNIIRFKEYEKTFFISDKACLCNFFNEKYNNIDCFFLRELKKCPLEIFTVENDDGTYYVYDTITPNKMTFDYILNQIDMSLNQE